MSGRYIEFDDLYVAIIMALPDSELVSLPKGCSVEELARRYPEIYQTCVETLKTQIRAKSPESCGMSLDSSDGTDLKA